VIKEVIVVEGKDDRSAVKRACGAEVIITNGLGLTAATLELIRQAQKRCGVIVLTDPDYPGEKITGIIDRAVPGCRHAYIYQRQGAEGQGRIGVEYASSGQIMEALHKVRFSERRTVACFDQKDLYSYELAGKAGSQKLRLRVGEILGLGQTNAKQFLHRLNAYAVSRRELEDALAKARGEMSEG
jgi:ribonuclease M5